MQPFINCFVRLIVAQAEKAKTYAQAKKWSLATWIREAIEEKIEKEEKEEANQNA